MIDHNGFRDRLSDELSELQRLHAQLEDSLRLAPQGNLNVLQQKGDTPRYYQCIDREHRSYLSKEKIQVASQLAQKEYDKKLLKLVEERISAGKRLLHKYDHNVDQIYAAIGPIRQRLLMNHFQTDKEYVCEWYERHPGGKNPYPINSDQYTVRGEHVRSKSEKILADMFERMGIPYVYEPMVMLENSKIVYPDFLILNVRYRKTCIFEHFGMMDNSEYSQNVCQKISAYAMSEIFPGDQLLFSMETKMKQLNEACVERMLSKWLASE